MQLTRQDASPVQVAAAEKILSKNPLSADELFVDLDPTSACVAAAYWLGAAAKVASEISDIAVADVVIEADNIEALPHATPTTVLELMEIGQSPTVAVTNLIRQAMRVAEGNVPDPDALHDEVEKAKENAQRYGQGDPEAVAEFMKIRLTPLDPRRPARDMLEDLLFGIRGCWLLYRQYVDLLEDEAEHEVSEDDLVEAIDIAFCEAVRGTSIR